jgi:cell division protein FtsA
MVTKSNLFALDLGTTKFCIGSLMQHQTQNPRLQIVDTPAKGMRRGMLADFDQAVSALNQLIEKAEAKFETDIRKIVVGVAGSHLRGQIVQQEVILDNEAVTEDHIQQLSELADRAHSDEFREVLHCIPVDYQLDDREPITNPHGFSGRKILGRFFIIDADQSYLKDTVRLCNQVGLEVSHMFSEPFASASVTIDDVHKERGVAIADIGGGTTDGLVFQNGRPVDIFTINIAGMMMTRDLAVGLGISEMRAESIKCDHGLSLSSMANAFEEDNIYGQKTRIEPKTVETILRARILELGGFLAESLKKYRGQLGAGVYLTGGGSKVKGLDQMLTEKFGIGVHSIDPLFNLNQTTFDQYQSRYATVIGLLNLELCRQRSLKSMRSQFWAKKYIDHFVNWIRELS